MPGGASSGNPTHSWLCGVHAAGESGQWRALGGSGRRSEPGRGSLRGAVKEKREGHQLRGRARVP